MRMNLEVATVWIRASLRTSAPVLWSLVGRSLAERNLDERKWDERSRARRRKPMQMRDGRSCSPIRQKSLGWRSSVQRMRMVFCG